MPTGSAHVARGVPRHTKRYLYVALCGVDFQVKMHVITANIFLAGLRKIAVMFSAMLHLARVC